MSEKEDKTVVIAIDIKKNRIRIHKSTIHLLGDPKYIQLLFNPEDMVVGLRCLDEAVPGDSAERVCLNRVHPDCSFELYSKSLITSIRSVANVESDSLIRLTGTVIPAERIAVFPMRNMQRMGS